MLPCSLDVLEHGPIKVALVVVHAVDDVLASQHNFLIVLFPLVFILEKASLEIGVDDKQSELLGLEHLFHHG